MYVKFRARRKLTDNSITYYISINKGTRIKDKVKTKTKYLCSVREEDIITYRYLDIINRLDILDKYKFEIMDKINEIHHSIKWR